MATFAVIDELRAGGFMPPAAHDEALVVYAGSDGSGHITTRCEPGAAATAVAVARIFSERLCAQCRAKDPSYLVSEPLACDIEDAHQLVRNHAHLDDLTAQIGALGDHDGDEVVFTHRMGELWTMGRFNPATMPDTDAWLVDGHTNLARRARDRFSEISRARGQRHLVTRLRNQQAYAAEEHPADRRLSCADRIVVLAGSRTPSEVQAHLALCAEAEARAGSTVARIVARSDTEPLADTDPWRTGPIAGSADGVDTATLELVARLWEDDTDATAPEVLDRARRILT